MFTVPFRQVNRSLMRWSATFTLLAIIAAGGWWFLAGTPPEPAFVQAMQPREKIAAPSFDGGIAWLNTEKPLSLADFKGRVVLLDFWTLCCINCIHTLPELAKLERKYPGVLVVIGVHSPKFPNEKKTESIRKAVLRYDIQHPIINDANMAIWRRYSVQSWPTLVLVDPDGNYYGHVSGEGVYDVLDQHIGKMVKEYRQKKLLKEDPLPFQLAKVKERGDTPLFFPGKVFGDAKSDRLYIADSTHHRIVITDLAGKKIAVAGNGLDGADDGPFAKASFSDPQGMALVGQTLYVADRKNHMIRALDLEKQTVKAVAGTGKQDRLSRFRGGLAVETGLNSPWDLLVHGDQMFVAMAGHHQIWTYDLKKKHITPYAGDGSEDLVDGALTESAFAQPSGLATDGKLLYVADCETSAVRSLPMDGKGEVKAIVGEGLFEFGDTDGVGAAVRLQHALGVGYYKGHLYVADTYNSKIKVIDPAKRSCKTLDLKRPADEQGPLLNEPGGLCFVGDKMYIADTNSHRIRVVDMNTLAISTLPLQGTEAPPAFLQGVKK